MCREHTLERDFVNQLKVAEDEISFRTLVRFENQKADPATSSS
jgi:hypothetical protein